MEDLIFEPNNLNPEQIIPGIDINTFNAYDQLPGMLFISQRSNGCVYSNNAWSKYTGQSGANSRGKGFEKYIHPHDRKFYCHTGYQSGTLPLIFESRVKDQSGIYRWHLNQVSVQRDSLNNYTGYLCTLTDIHSYNHPKQKQNPVDYKTFAEAMPALAFVADAQGAVNYYNQRWYDFICYKSGTEGWGWTVADVIHPDDLQHAIDSWNYSIKNGTPYQIEYRLRRYDGQYLWHLVNAVPLRNKKGAIDCWLGTGISIHSLKLSEIALARQLQQSETLEQQLQKEHELFHAIFDNIPVMLSIFDPALNVMKLNKAITEVTGWTPDDYNTHGIMPLVYPDKQYRQQIAGYMASLAPGFKEIKMTGKDGSVSDTLWANIHISGGRNVGIGIDITERKKQEHNLAALSAHFQAVVENITDGVVAYSPQGEIISINKAAREMLSSLKLNKESPHSLDDFVMYDSNGVILERDEWPRMRVIRGESVVREEFRTYFAPTQKEMYLEYSGIPIFEDGKLVLAIITMKDITQRRKTHLELLESHHDLMSKNRELEKINNLHENLLYIIAHDLRNPIHNMYLITDILRKIKDEEEHDKLISLLRDTVKRQENIVKGLVELLEVQSGETATPSLVVLDNMVHDILLENEAVLRECQANIDVDFSAAPTISYIPSFIESIVKNLINNAIKYRRQEQKLQLTLTSYYHDAFVVMVIKDNGIGIDMRRFRKNLFQPFKRYTAQAEGTGMGLYLVKNLIEKNGGYIDLESTLDEGTTFKCYFKPLY